MGCDAEASSQVGRAVLLGALGSDSPIMGTRAEALQLLFVLREIEGEVLIDGIVVA